MFTWIDMLLVAIIVAILTVLIILFLFGATILEREEQAYKKGYYKGTKTERKPKSNGDKIRSLTDEELAERIVKLDLGEAPYCGPNNERCNNMLDKGELIPSDMCKQCCVRWLQQVEK